MQLDDVVERYKGLSSRNKFALLTLLATLHPLYEFSFSYTDLDEHLQSSQIARDQAEIKFKKAREQKDKLPKLEEQLSFTEGELLKASKKLPNQFQMDQILAKVAMIAQDVGVTLQVFQPGEPTVGGEAFKYLELPIGMQLLGTFSNVASFFDRVVHLEMLVHFRDMDLSTATNRVNPLQSSGSEFDDRRKKDSGLSSLARSADTKKAALERSKANRKEIRVATTAKMIIFRSLTDEENYKVEQAQANNGNKNPGGVPPQPKAP